MSDGMRRELVYLSSHATNRYFIPNWGIYMFSKLKCFHGFKSIIHTFECKKDIFPSVGRRYKKERPKPLFM